MNEQLKDFLKKASEDESIKDELKECRTGGCNRAESRLRLVGRGLRPFIGGTR